MINDEAKLLRLRDKVAIITGAGSGIGRESALLFAREGAKLIVADISEEAGRETVGLIGKDALFVKVDVSNWTDTERMIQVAVKQFGRLDILFNNAGIYLTRATALADTSEADWDKMVAINLKGVFLGIRHALPVMMRQRSGVILSTASVAGILTRPKMAAYCATKGGVVALTRQLAVEYAKYNIRVNCLCPGGMEKPMGGRHIAAEILARHGKRIAQITPLGRTGTTRELAAAALYLVSDEASYVTGIPLIVDGGALAS